MALAELVARFVRAGADRMLTRTSTPQRVAGCDHTKRDWIVRHLRCPTCLSDALRLVKENRLRCGRCGTVYPAGRPINMLTGELKRKFQLVETENVSDHAYSKDVRQLIDETGAAGGMVLDAGAGSRSESWPCLVQLEIKEYANIDVLGANQTLPFRDESFDGAISLDVLEHVDDPFASAREIVRVLKPGGWLYVDVPFMQHEHGYPHHYFNMTRMGLRRLFADGMTFEQHYVPTSGHPIYTLYSALVNYNRGLPPEVREQFRGQTIGEFLDRGPKDWYQHPIFRRFEDDKKWVMASTTRAVLRKRRAA